MLSRLCLQKNNILRSQVHLERPRIVTNQAQRGEEPTKVDDWAEHPVLPANRSHRSFVLGAVGKETSSAIETLASEYRKRRCIGKYKCLVFQDHPSHSIERGAARLLSRNGNWFKSFTILCDSLASDMNVRSAVLDGEIVCLDKQGCAQFNRLLYRRGDPRFYAFDLLFLNGRDLRKLPLVERKARLRDIVPAQRSPVLFCDYIEASGDELFEVVCARDLEGIVAKWKLGQYVSGPETSWITITNPAYSQMQGRREQFDKMRQRVASAGK